jgi:hypothetical protein
VQGRAAARRVAIGAKRRPLRGDASVSHAASSKRCGAVAARDKRQWTIRDERTRMLPTIKATVRLARFRRLSHRMYLSLDVAHDAARKRERRRNKTNRILAMNNVTHSLAPAVGDGTISAETAFCGLCQDDIKRLMARHAGLHVLVRHRSARADGRAVFTVREFHTWWHEGIPRLIDGVLWYTDDIRDVLALAVPVSR